MTDINTDSTGSATGSASTSGANGNGSAATIKDPTAYESKQRELLAEVKKERDARKILETRMLELDQQKMQAEGKKDEVISQLNKQITDLRDAEKKKTSKYAFKVVKEKVAAKASSLGAIDTETLLKIVDLNALQVSVVDDDFEVDEDSITNTLETLRKEKPFLFKQAGPTIKDGTPNGGSRTQVINGAPDFTKMKTDEILDWAKNNSDKIR
jgi:seryl-tRNA synthetase